METRNSNEQQAPAGALQQLEHEQGEEANGRRLYNEGHVEEEVDDPEENMDDGRRLYNEGHVEEEVDDLEENMDDGLDEEEEEDEDTDEDADAALEALFNQLQQQLQEDDEPIPLIMSQNDPRRMRLTAEEKSWAAMIKVAVEDDPDVDNLTDYDYGQLALICRHDARDAVERLRHLQAFREEYDIKDTLEDGARTVREFMNLMPKYWLHFCFDREEGVYIHIQDMSEFDTSVLDTQRKLNTCHAAMYYIFHAANPDMATTRKGGTSIMDCMDVPWSRKPDYKVFGKLLGELTPNYPTKAGKLLFYNTGVIFNSLLTFIKTALPKELTKTFDFGFVTDTSMADFFLVPNPEAANKRLVQSISEVLARRYENVRSFTLNTRR